MKNLFLTLALVLVSSVGFGSNGKVKELPKETAVIEKTANFNDNHAVEDFVSVEFDSRRCYFRLCMTSPSTGIKTCSECVEYPCGEKVETVIVEG